MLVARMLVLVAVLSAGACNPPPPKQVGYPQSLPDPGDDGVYHVLFPQPKPAEVRTIALTIGTDGYQQCGFSPHFEVNSVDPLPQDLMQMQALAECLNEREVKALPIELVGRADARGSLEYNKELGRTRAERVRELLASYGVAPDRMQVKTVGEHGARGVSPTYAHGYDRRVDVVLTSQEHAPNPPTNPRAASRVATAMR